MSPVIGHTRDGGTWTPQFIDAVDFDKCIGCGRCYKVCGRDVLEPIEKPFEGEDEFGDDLGNMVMSVANPGNCIGCQACARTCTKKSQVFIEL